MERLPQVRQLIDNKLYFVLHAPRQVGKTTALLTLARELTAEGSYAAVIVSVETAVPFGDNVDAAEKTILDAWRSNARVLLPTDLQPPPWPDAEPGARIRNALQAWAEACPRPLVVFIDEIDALEGPVLLSILRQIRHGYANRPAHFPHSLAVIGMRNVRDYKFSSGGADRSHSASPFNIAAEALALRNFTQNEVAELLGQHTAETGQVFLPDAIDRVYELSQGQPWLVNALARQLVEVVVKDTSQAIAVDHVNQAKIILIARQDTHIDSLAERLREERVRAVIEPILTSGRIADIPADDQQFVCDLGLIRVPPDGPPTIANPIYEEIFVRVLSTSIRWSIPKLQPKWLKPDGRLDFSILLDSFLTFWRKNGEPLLGSSPYHEYAPHLVLMSFLDRVANGGGTVERESAIGTGRVDLLVTRGLDQLAIEIKVWRQDKERDPLNDGLEQLDGYLARLNMDTGWLMIFDRRPSAPELGQRMGFSRMNAPSGKEITVVRL